METGTETSVETGVETGTGADIKEADMDTDPLERDPIGSKPDPLVRWKAPRSGAAWLARTLAESYPLGNGRIGLGAADLKFLARSPHARLRAGVCEKPRIDNKTTPSYVSARTIGAPNNLPTPPCRSPNSTAVSAAWTCARA